MSPDIGILRGFGGRLAFAVCPLAAVICVACGGSGSDGAAAPGLLGQAPHCPEADVLRIEGSVGAGEIADTRFVPNINAGLENIGSSPRFYTPVSTPDMLASNQLALELSWQGSLAYGDASTAVGTLTLPANHPDAGTAYCVTKAEVGFIDGGVEDGAFKFVITEIARGLSARPLYPGRVCPVTDERLAVDIRGCFQ